MAPRILNPLSRLRSRTRDVTSSLVRPTPLDQRIARNPITRWVARLALATVVVAGGTSLFFFPLMDFVTQRSASQCPADPRGNSQCSSRPIGLCLAGRTAPVSCPDAEIADGPATHMAIHIDYRNLDGTQCHQWHPFFSACATSPLRA
ncbi:MAG: hypothetical protein GM46_0935 [actinobacterium acAcidi]|nr:MAG: hypothetical protein GM46_0935 [actinobacterium acAcidi]